MMESAFGQIVIRLTEGEEGSPIQFRHLKLEEVFELDGKRYRMTTKKVYRFECTSGDRIRFSEEGDWFAANGSVDLVTLADPADPLSDEVAAIVGPPFSGTVRVDIVCFQQL